MSDEKHLSDESLDHLPEVAASATIDFIKQAIASELGEVTPCCLAGVGSVTAAKIAAKLTKELPEYRNAMQEAFNTAMQHEFPGDAPQVAVSGPASLIGLIKKLASVAGVEVDVHIVRVPKDEPDRGNVN